MRRNRGFRVLHVFDHSVPLHSGYSFRSLAIIREQRARGWRTFHFTGPKQGGELDEELVEGLHFHRTQARPASRPWLNEAQLMWQVQARLMAVAREVIPDVLQVHSPVLNALPALWVARRLGLPLVYEVRAFWEDASVDHGTTHEGSVRYRASRALETFVLRRADHVTTICQGLAREIRSRGVESRRITVIPNAVDVSRFTPDGVPDPALQAQLGLTGKRVIGFVGSFYAYEGLSLLIEALPAVRAQHPDLVVLLAGGGPAEAALREQAAQSPCADAVVFAGRVRHEEVTRYYDLMEVMVYPRLPMRLTELVTPLKPLEAMAQGRLALASDVGGHRELIEHGRTGWLFEAGSAQALATSLIELLGAPHVWPALRQSAREAVGQQRTWARSVARYQGVFEDLVERH